MDCLVVTSVTYSSPILIPNLMNNYYVIFVDNNVLPHITQSKLQGDSLSFDNRFVKFRCETNLKKDF